MWPLIISLLFVSVSGQSNSNQVCRTIVSSLSCQQFDYKPICGTDGVQYKTECDFAKAHCNNAGLKVMNEGTCAAGMTTGAPVMTTPAGPMDTTGMTQGPGTTQGQVMTTQGQVMTTQPPVVTTVDPSLTPVCQQIVATACAGENNPLCGTDGMTYQNYCEFSKSRCYFPSLEIAYSGGCSPTDTFIPPTRPTRAPSVFDIICRTLEQVTCTDDGATVCGSDGVTYPTACDFEKAKCKNVMLSVSATGC